MTGFVPVMWAAWAVLVAITLGLKIYTGRLTRDEDDQLVLDPAFDRVRDEQAAIVAKVNKVEPVTRVMMWLVVAMTIVVIGYYIMDFMTQFK
jgi:hypothetical protein